MHNIISARNLFSNDPAGIYSFPDISKETVMIDGADPKSSGTSFQRIYVDLNADRPVEPLDGSFIKSSFLYRHEGIIEDTTNENIEIEKEPEPIDYQKVIDDVISESLQKETAAYHRGFQDGQKDGFQEGHKAGFAEGMKEIERLLGSLQQAMNEIKKFRKELMLQAERETVGLSLAIARKILQVEPAVNPKVIAGVVKRTFETIAINAPVRIRINPSELSYLQEGRHLIPIKGEVIFIEDSSVSCGGCIVETLSGDIDARIESQLKMVEESFLPGLEKNAQDLEMIS